MDDQSLSSDSGMTKDNRVITSEPDNMLADSVRAAAGLSGGALEAAVNEFLSGEGELLETTRTAITRGGSSAVTEIAAFLTDKFKLSSTVAALVATLLVKLFPSIKKLTGKRAAAKKKPRSKAKVKKKTTAKKKPTSSKKKKAAAKPKTAAKKTAAKKKTTSQAAKKKAKAKPKKTKRVSTVGEQ